MTLIAEDVLLLLLDDDRGTVSGTSYLPTALGGAVLVELAIAGAVTVEEKTSVWRSAKVRPGPTTPPDDPILRDAVATVAERERSAQDLVGRLGKGLKERLAESLVAREILEREDDKVFGLFPRKRWPTLDARHEEEVRRSLTAVLVEGAEPDERTGGLVAILSAIDRAHKVVDHGPLSSREVRRRAKEIAAGDWAAKAVRDAIAAANAAVMAAITASTAAGAAGGS